ncbi:hypothetical protein, partial [Alloprevotella sp. OH1205_COT-284]|uniref:hypothetical protein n=1 Tax=Alloprevotella sp. OH1205_COT-284 TaxID=2491043 RepID=UPI0013158556
TQAHYWIELFEAKDGLGSQRGSKHISAEETQNAAIHTFSCDGLGKGTYYVQLYMQQKFGGYTLNYKHVPPSLANDPESNDKPETASVLNSGRQVTGRLGYSYHNYTDQYDYYKIVLEDDGKVEFAWSLPATQAHYWIELFEAKDGLGSQRGSKHISA